MNKRLRKKKCKGEFAWKGFEVSFYFEPHLEACEADDFVDDMIAFVEANDIGMGGVTRLDGAGYFLTKWVPCPRSRRLGGGRIRHRPDHCTEVDQEKVRVWLTSKPFVKDVVIGRLE